MDNAEMDDMDEFEVVDIGIDEPVFTTGVVCRILDIPVWVLKKLDAEGIVCPTRLTKTSARLYSQKELKKIRHCWFYMKIHKVRVHGLKVILKIEDRQ